MLDPLSFSNKQKIFENSDTICDFEKVKKILKRIFEGHGLLSVMISMNLKKTKTKVLVVKRKYFGFGGKICVENRPFFHIRLQLII